MKRSVRKTWLLVLGMILAVFAGLLASACSPKTYTLTFETDGGMVIAPITAKAGEEITPPADPEKDEYRFEGWYTQADFSGESVEIPSVMPDSNITYYAKYREYPTAVLTLDAGIGTLETTTYRVGIGENVSAFLADVVPSVSGQGVTFGGWFNGSSELSSSLTMPAAGLTLTARYRVAYTVEVYMQNTAGEYVLDEESEVEGGTDWVGEIIDFGFELDVPAGHRFDSAASADLTLVADSSQNVYKIYYARRSYLVSYLANAPTGATASGTMEDDTAYYGSTIEVPACGYTISGYRFAGWATAADGAIVYQAGQELSIGMRAVQLYAVWNYGATDANGGSDTIYLLAEKENTVLLEREYLGEKEGTYDAATRAFRFTTPSGEILRGRFSADGTTFAYYYEEFAVTLTQYDEAASALVSTVTLALDGIDGAEYRDTAQGITVSGTYAPVDSGIFLFESETLTFRFIMGTLRSSGQEIFLMSDEVAGSYYFYYSGRLFQYPFLTLDGFGSATYRTSSTASAQSGSYEIVSEDLVRVEFSSGSVVFRLSTLTTTSGATYLGFEEADAVIGTYTVTLTDAGASGGTGTLTITLDGFGGAVYSYAGSEEETNVETTYTYVTSYTVDSVQYALFRFTRGDETYAIRVTLGAETPEAVVVGSEAGVYAEYNSRSGYTAALMLYGDGTASMLFLMQSGSYSTLITGTYAASGSNYVFTASTYGEGVEDLLSPYYGSYTFCLYPDSAAFGISDGAAGFYTFTSGTASMRLVCDGFGRGTLSVTGQTATRYVPYDVVEGYTEGGTTYRFISFVLSSSTYWLRVAEGSTEATLYTGYMGYYYDLPTNRISAYTERLHLFPDGHAEIEVSTDGGETYQTVVSGTYAINETSTAMVFTATSGATEGYACYASFLFLPGTAAGGNAFFYYDASEVLSFGSTLSLDGFGLATYGGSQYLYRIGDGVIELCNAYGTAVLTIRYNAAEGTIETPGSEAGNYYSYLYSEASGQYLIGAYRLELDGFGGATLYQASEETGEYVSVTTGTYTGDATNGYTVTFTETAYNCSFILTTRSISGTSYYVYVQSDESLVMTYTIEGGEGAAVQVDEYGRVSYRTADGGTRNAVYVISEDSAIANRMRMILLVYNEAGTGYEGLYYYIVVDSDPNDAQATLRALDDYAGSYVHLEGSTIHTAVTLVLDGFGGATYTDADGVEVTGTYAAGEERNVLTFTPGDPSAAGFVFRLTSVTSTSGTSYSAFIVYDAGLDVLISSNDWSLLMLDGYISATYIDFNGVAYEGNYVALTETLVRVYGSSFEIYITVNVAEKTFAIVTDEFVVSGGTLYAYRGEGGAVRIPDGVTTIASGVFSYNTTITSIDLNGVVTIGNQAFYGNLIQSFTGTENVRTIGAYAFCQSLYVTAFSFPAAETVGASAFSLCVSLTSVSFGEALTSVGANAFAQCGTAAESAFTLRLAGSTAPTMGTDVFTGTSAYVVVNDIAAVIAYRTAWAENGYAAYVTLPATGGDGTYTDATKDPAVTIVVSGGQIMMDGALIGVYTLSGSEITIYLFDASASGGYVTVTGTLENGTVSVTIGAVSYTFTQVTESGSGETEATEQA